MPVEITRCGSGKNYPTTELRKIAAALLRKLGKHRTELSVALVGDKEMRPLNAKYRNTDKTTDVLSFAVDDQPPGHGILLGDVIISVEQARRQAKQRKVTLKSEMALLLIHGVLHLLGHNHEGSGRRAKIMFSLERKLLAYLCDRGLLKV